MATANFKKSAKKASTKAVYLLEIDLVNIESDPAAYGHRTLYLSSKYFQIETVQYEGLVSGWGGMDVGISNNEGLSHISDFSIELINTRLMFQDYATDTRFSDLFSHYYFAGSICRVYQWFEDLTAKSDALLIFSGITKQAKFNSRYVSFDIEENISYIDIPVDIVTLNEYPDAPVESINSPLPIFYGNEWEWNDLPTTEQSLTPCICVDATQNKFCIAAHQTKSNALGVDTADFKLFLRDAGIYGEMIATPAYIINDENGSFYNFGYNTYYSFKHIPIIRGSESDISDYSNVIDYSDATTLQLTASQKLYLKFDSFPTLGELENSNSVSIKLFVKVTAVTGASPYGVMKYYNEAYDGGAGSASTGTNITGTGTLEYPIHSDLTAHGNDPAQVDQNFAWNLRELAGYQYGLTVSAACTITIAWMYLSVSAIPISYFKPGYVQRIPRP